MERCQNTFPLLYITVGKVKDFEKTRHGHVWGQISQKVDVSFLPNGVCIFSYTI